MNYHQETKNSEYKTSVKNNLASKEENSNSKSKMLTKNGNQMLKTNHQASDTTAPLQTTITDDTHSSRENKRLCHDKQSVAIHWQYSIFEGSVT